jgi:hypothetical protein
LGNDTFHFLVESGGFFPQDPYSSGLDKKMAQVGIIRFGNPLALFLCHTIENYDTLNCLPVA